MAYDSRLLDYKAVRSLFDYSSFKKKKKINVDHSETPPRKKKKTQRKQTKTTKETYMHEVYITPFCTYSTSILLYLYHFDPKHII